MSATRIINNSDTDSDTAFVQNVNSNSNSTNVLSFDRKTITVALLCFVNLINYMDRYTVAGVLTEITNHFGLDDGQAGFLQTAFVLSFMLFAPLFGYLGDRYSRNIIMIVGISIWSITTLCGSFVDNIGWFIFFRAMVGLGEASYSTISPTIISDLFVKDQRSKMLAIFYFAIPVGSGLGYIVGAEMAAIMNSWRWALRITPILGLIAVVLMFFLLKNPERGEAEGGQHVAVVSYKEDLKELVKNRSFMLSSLGFTCVTFVAGALSWWGPHYIFLGLQLQNSTATLNEVSMRFGVVSMFSGLLGVPLGAWLSRRYNNQYPDIDPLISGFSLLCSTPLVYLAVTVAATHEKWCYIFIFFGSLLFNLCWSLVADMLLYVVVPTRRSTAEAFQILISHALGDAGSPYLIGLVSEALKIRFLPNKSPRPSVDGTIMSALSMSESQANFKSLQYAMYITGFVEVLGGIFFLITALYIVKDRKKVDKVVSENPAIQPRNVYAEEVSAEEESKYPVENMS